MLKNYFLPQLTRALKRQVVFQQDVAPVHYGRQVRQFLDNEFSGRWLGRCGPLTWSKRYLKTQVYIMKPQNLQQLKDLIVKEANSISKEFLEKSINSFRTCLQR